MNLPPGYTEEQVLDLIDRSAAILAPAFAFGPYEVEDIKQECVLLAMDLLAKNTYAAGRPLANYIYSHLQRRLINFRRDNFRRADAPCRECHDGRPCDGGKVCRRYARWARLQDRKSSLARVGFGATEEPYDRAARCEPVEDDVAVREVLQLLDARLPVEQRRTMLRMRAGVRVGEGERTRLEAAVRRILAGVDEVSPLREVYRGLVQGLLRFAG